MFQRLVTAGDHADELPYNLKFELYSYNPALFEFVTYPFSGQQVCPGRCPLDREPTGTVQFVLEGGALLHDRICQLYADYVSKKYGKPTVVFDGYQDGVSTKVFQYILLKTWF